MDKLNMDRAKRWVIETASMEWEASPAQGVWRKKLEREAVESGQTTSIVRYEPGTSFSPHNHPKGEEIYVISGIFADENGEYPAGTYLRNPSGYVHGPNSPEGCVIFVKLNMFQDDDTASVRIDTTRTEWLPGLVEGLSVMSLHTHGVEHTALVKWAPNTVFNPHTHPGGEEILVLEGMFEDEQGQYPKGTWLRNPSYSTHKPFSREGCTILVKTGHLG